MPLGWCLRADRTGAGARLGWRAGGIRSWRTARDGARNAAGWRAAFFALAALTAVVGVLVAVMLPDVRSQADERRPAPGRLRQMVTVIGSNTLVFVGQYTLYTYVSVLLLRSGASTLAVGPILLVFGAFGLIGVWSAGPRLDATCAALPWRSWQCWPRGSRPPERPFPCWRW